MTTRQRKSRATKRGRGNPPQDQEQVPIIRHPIDIPAKYQPKVTIEKLREKKFVGHRTIDWPTLANLGLRDRFEKLLTSEWRRLFAITTPVYRDLVYEFYSTFRLNITLGNTSATAMTFRLGGSEFTWSIAEFGVQMGLYTEEEVMEADFKEGLCTWPHKDSVGAFWRDYELGDDYYSNNTKQSQMNDPAYRILLRLIAESISSRDNCTNNATAHDLFYLYCLVTHTPCNLARCLALYLYEKGHGKEKGAICGGSFICHLAFRLGVANESQLEVNGGPVALVTTFNVAALTRIGILNNRGELVASVEAEASEEEEETEQQPLRQHRQRSDPYSMQGLARQLESIQQHQLSFQNTYREDQRMIHSQFDRVMYHQDRYQPYLDHWAQQEAESMGQPLPPYAPPDIFMPTYRQGGFYYPPQAPQGDGASGSHVPPQFGTFGGGTSSIFPNPNDMNE